MLLVRNANYSDLNEIVEIEKKLFSSPWSKNSFEQELSIPNSIFLVALIDGKVIGYICLRILDTEGHLVNLAILSDYQNKGYASKLLKIIIEQAKKMNLRFLFLEVRKSNFKAQRLYQKFGFKVYGTRKNYYSNKNEDALLMRCDLSVSEKVLVFSKESF